MEQLTHRYTITTITLSIGTYLAAALLVWAVLKSDKISEKRKDSRLRFQRNLLPSLQPLKPNRKKGKRKRKFRLQMIKAKALLEQVV
jgi:hypothetical protein